MRVQGKKLIDIDIEWSPTIKGCNFIYLQKFVTINPNRVEFRLTSRAKFFFWGLLLFGSSLFVGVFSSIMFQGFYSIDLGKIFLLCASSIILVASGLILYDGNRLIVFDKEKGFFWKGSDEPNSILKVETVKTYIALESICAIQLIQKNVAEDLTSNEMNLVLTDGSRINVVDHPNHYKINEDSKRLSDFLGVPILNGIKQT